MKIVKQEDWQIQPLPSKYVTLQFNLPYSLVDMKRIRRGLLPKQMEDKWFIYFKDDVLYLHRSWTGFCVYKAYFKIEGVTCLLTSADVNRDKEQYSATDDEYDRHMLSYLIDLLLLQKPAVFPTNDGPAEETAIKQGSVVGQAMFGDSPGAQQDIVSERRKPVVRQDRNFVRIIPVNRFMGLPARVHRPYAFYSDSTSLEGLTVAEAYRLVMGINLPPRDWGKECRTPFAWELSASDLDSPLMKINIAGGKGIQYEEFPQKWLDRNHFVVLKVSQAVAERELDIFPATWKALSYIVSDPSRMGARESGWDMEPEEYAKARIHALFEEIQLKSGGNLLALCQTKESLGLNDLERLADPAEELEYYHYLSKNSLFTNKVVELFGISHRCWHGCGYLGWPGEPLCRFFLLRNIMVPGMQVSIMRGKDLLSKC
jgi:hypothetical protein